jgi:two-component system, sensor histidine kinase
MGGRIDVTCPPDGGASFHFVLSFGTEADTLPGDITAHHDDGDTTVLTGQVLVVDDNEVNRLITVEMLQSLGMVDILEAADGAQALEQMAHHAVQLVLMDCQMPGIDGYDATRFAREREARLGLPRVPIVAVTANAFDEDVARALAAGMDGHLAKPFTRNQLRELLADWI